MLMNSIRRTPGGPRVSSLLPSRSAGGHPFLCKCVVGFVIN